MALLGFEVDTQGVTLTASTAVTVCQVVAATNTRVAIKRLDATVNGITAADPQITLDVLIQSSAGTMSSLTPIKRRSTDTETLQTTAQKTATAEPTAGNILMTYFCHPMYGMPPILFDPPLEVPGGTRLGFRATPGTLTAATKMSITLDCEE